MGIFPFLLPSNESFGSSNSSLGYEAIVGGASILSLVMVAVVLLSVCILRQFGSRTLRVILWILIGDAVVSSSILLRIATLDMNVTCEVS